MNFINYEVSFLLQSVLITIPGLLTPGPVMAITIERGTRSPHAGAFVTAGHFIVELPFVVLLYFGLGRFAKEPAVRFILGFTGGIFLIYLAWKTFRNRRMVSAPGSKIASSAFTAGMVMTLANPFLLLWWGTVGSSLLIRSMEFGPMVTILFYVLHISMNFIWLYLLSFLSYKGYTILGSGYRFAVAIICGVLLSGFGIYFVVTAFRIA